MKLSEENKDFFKDVYEVVKCIPQGRVTSYGTIARYLGKDRGARMVGWALNGSIASDPSIPAHRVVNRLGMLTGKVHFNPPGRMQELLEKEGLSVKEDKVVDFSTYFWDPEQEL